MYQNMIIRARGIGAVSAIGRKYLNGGNFATLRVNGILISNGKNYQPAAINAGALQKSSRSTASRVRLRTSDVNTLIGLSMSSSSIALSAISLPRVAGYRPPSTGLVSYLPQSWIPYAELIRLDKPTGTYYLFFPCIFSTLMAATYTSSPPFTVLSTTVLFLTGALIMRGAGCTINDFWDRNLDPYVQRTRHRPIARGAISPFNAVAFVGVQLLAGLGILLQFPTPCLYYGIPSLLLVVTYPLAKRVTYYPQFVLGLTFSWGAIMGFPALGVDVLTDSVALKAVAALYGSCVSWTVFYDMIYAHMDIKDDARIGIKSIALKHENQTKAILSALSIIQVGLLAVAGTAYEAGPLFYFGSCGSAAVTLGCLIWKVRLREVTSCWWWFKNGAWLTGGGIAMGLLADYSIKICQPSVERDEVLWEDSLSK